MIKPRDFFMDTDLLDKALGACDLGDGYLAKVRMYPHKDTIPLLTHVREVLPIDWDLIWSKYIEDNIAALDTEQIQELVEKSLKGEL